MIACLTKSQDIPSILLFFSKQKVFQLRFIFEKVEQSTRESTVWKQGSVCYKVDCQWRAHILYFQLGLKVKSIWIFSLIHFQARTVVGIRKGKQKESEALVKISSTAKLAALCSENHTN